MTSKNGNLSMAAIAAAFIAGPAMASGPVTDTEQPPVIITPEPQMDWTGGYAGVVLGFGSGTYGNGTNFPGDGQGDWDGTTYGLALGYNFQNGNMVYGGELTYSGADISGTEDCVNPAFQCAGTLDNIATLRGRVGYLLQPETLIYGTLGVAQGEHNFWTDDGTVLGQTRTVSGYLAGVGVEHAFSDRMSLRGAIVYYEFDEDDYQTDVLYNDIDSDFTQFELGIFLRF